MGILSNLIYVAMAVFVFIGCIGFDGNGLFKLLNSIRDFDKTTREKVNEANGESLRRELLSETIDPAKDIFNDETLVYQLQLYQEEVMKTESEGGGNCYCDIGEFFNYELLDQISNNNFNEYISSVLTALGVLGTFIGLSFGLAEFDTTSSEQIMSGVNNLLEGMSFAFTTSIVGISLSLIYGSVLRGIRSKAEKKLDLFLDNFRKYVLNNNKEISSNRVERSLRKMETFSTDVIDAIRIPMEEMKSSLDHYCAFATEKQIEAIQQLTDGFVERLNVVLQENMDELSNSMSKAAEQNNAYVESFSTITVQVEAMTNQMKEMCKGLQGVVEKYKQINSNVQSVNDGFVRELEKIHSIVEKDREVFVAQQNVTAKMLESIHELEKLSVQLVRESQQMAETIETLDNCSTEVIGKSQMALEEQIRTLMLDASDFAVFITSQSNECAEAFNKHLQIAQNILEQQIHNATTESKTEITQEMLESWKSEVKSQNEYMIQILEQMLVVLNGLVELSRKKGIFKFRGDSK